MTEQNKQVLQRTIDTLVSAVNLVSNHNPSTSDINVNSLCCSVDSVVFSFLSDEFVTLKEED